MLWRLAVVMMLTLAQAIWPVAALAQTETQSTLTTLTADSIAVSGSDTVTASGNVEVLYQGQRLLASRIIYNRVTDTLRIEGPITLIEADGQVLVASEATLSGTLDQGTMKDARMLLDGQMQIAAVELNRVDGRFNQLFKAIASSCKVLLGGGKVPLWQIRARSIVHDQIERQLYFDNARFEVMGVPVAYFPRLRLPDPTLRRSTGFLIPVLRNSSNLGIGIKFPYFVTLGDSADFTFTPYISSKTKTLEGRFRREFRFGSLVLDGAISRDDLTTDEFRSYLFAEGRFRLPKDFRLNVDLRVVSDPGYLLTYDYSDVDRLGSGIEITRTRRDEYISASVQKLRSLRAVEVPIEDSLATLLGRFTYERRMFPAMIGGEARFVFDLEGHERLADTVDATLAAACLAATAPECSARDVVRAGALANWRRDWTFGNGIVSAVEGQLAADFYLIGQDAGFAGELTHATPTAAVEFRWPWSRVTASGATEILEPMMQLAWTDTLGANVPNEDSRLVDFDEGNMLNLSRFPGSDRYERGWRATLGFSWTRFAPGGDQYALTMGRVIRGEDLGQFTAASGLDGASSDWLVAGQIKRDRLTLTNRSLFDDTFSFSKSETQLAWRGDKIGASGSFIYVVDDPAEGRTGDTSELNLSADYRFNPNWTASVSGQYDGNTNQATNGGFGLRYQNECVNINFSLSRRFTSSTNVAASTEYGLSVSLNGFGTGNRDPARSCQDKS